MRLSRQPRPLGFTLHLARHPFSQRAALLPTYFRNRVLVSCKALRVNQETLTPQNCVLLIMLAIVFAPPRTGVLTSQRALCVTQTRARSLPRKLLPSERFASSRYYCAQAFRRDFRLFRRSCRDTKHGQVTAPEQNVSSHQQFIRVDQIA